MCPLRFHIVKCVSLLYSAVFHDVFDLHQTIQTSKNTENISYSPMRRVFFPVLLWRDVCKWESELLFIHTDFLCCLFIFRYQKALSSEKISLLVT